MERRNTLNNIILGNKRKDPVYQAVMTDLALAGVVDVKVAEALLGYRLPSYLKLPPYFDKMMEEAIAKDTTEPEDVAPTVTGEAETPSNESADEDNNDSESFDSEVNNDEAGNK